MDFVSEQIRCRTKFVQLANEFSSYKMSPFLHVLTSPLTAIQAFARADYIAQIPGMEWVGGGSVSQFVNGYLPVAALLALTMVLPLIFQFVATKYEKRKLLSDVQNSMLGRYFYFQCLNLYISVTAGGVWKSLADIIDHPTSILTLLGESLPFMVGYFVSLLVTKVLVGLPTVFLRSGALAKLVLRRTLSSAGKLTQRELDEIYAPENILVSLFRRMNMRIENDVSISSIH